LSSTTTACRPVAARAIFTAFSTASEPELNRTVVFGCSPGVIALSRSQTATYGSYGATMKQVWVAAATCSRTASTTRGADTPTVATPMPAARSMSWLPSTSTTIAPEAAAA
jgi:hypothetical protein